MPQPASTRLALVGPSGTDALSIGDDQIRAIITQLEAVGAGYIVDVAGSRPSAAAANKGYVFIASDTGTISFSTGAAWIAVDVAGAAAAAQAASQPLDADLTLYAAAAGPGAQLGLNDGTTVRRGKSIIATSESRTNTAYGLLTTPDRVQNVVLPTDGLIYVVYQATWQSSVATAASAALFLGAAQAQIANQPAPSVFETAIIGTNVARDVPLSIGVNGIQSGTTAAAAYTGDVTTGQVTGILGSGTGYSGPVTIFATAGIYDISVQFKASSGSVTAKNRKLWVLAVGF